MRKVALTTLCLWVLVVVASPASDHQDGPLLCLSANCQAKVKTYTLGEFPGIPVITLKDLAKAAGATIEAKAATTGKCPCSPDCCSSFRVEGTKLTVVAGGKTIRPSQSLMVQRSGEISAKLIRHVGEIWIPVRDLTKMLGATVETSLEQAGPGQVVRVSIRAGCDSCVFVPR